jgi:hypothetical protein
MSSLQDNECPICLDIISPADFTYTLTIPCNHHYHAECIKSWTQLSASTCPQCRMEILHLQIVNSGEMIKVNRKEADKLSSMVVEPMRRDLDMDPRIRTQMHSLSSNQYSSVIGTGIAQIRGDGRNERSDSHLTGQQCCICDSSVLINQIIVCPQCSALYHRSCSDGLNCPLCEEWIDDVTPPTISVSMGEVKRRRGRRNVNVQIDTAMRRDDGEYYTKLVDEMHGRENEAQRDRRQGIAEEEAWNALEQLKRTESESLESSTISIDTPTESYAVQEQEPERERVQDRKLKRPKCRSKLSSPYQPPPEPIPLKLTESALARLDCKFRSSHKSPKAVRPPAWPNLHHHRQHIPASLNSNPKHLHLPHPHKHSHSHSHPLPQSKSQKGLSYTQKLVIQRMLLKPRLNKMNINEVLTFDSYTELNKNISHQLYDKISENEIAISHMNAVIELAEREGFLPFDSRERVDEFNKAHFESSIVMRFGNCGWGQDSGPEFIESLIEKEVSRLMR